MPQKNKQCKCGIQIWSNSLRCRKCAKHGKLNPMFGRSQTEHQKETLSKRQEGSRNHQWKGARVKYGALHEWIRKNFGQPSVCENCGKKNLTNRKIHWANRSGKYLRNRTDWIRLCVPCHSRLGKEQKSMTVAVNGDSRVRELKEKLDV